MKAWFICKVTHKNCVICKNLPAYNNILKCKNPRNPKHRPSVTGEKYKKSFRLRNRQKKLISLLPVRKRNLSGIIGIKNSLSSILEVILKIIRILIFVSRKSLLSHRLTFRSLLNLISKMLFSRKTLKKKFCIVG